MLSVKLINGKVISLDLVDCIFNKFPIPGILVKEISLYNEDNGAKWHGTHAEFAKQFFCICRCKNFEEAMQNHEITLHYDCNPTECRIYEFEGKIYTADYDGGWVTEPYAIDEKEALELITEADYFIWRQIMLNFNTTANVRIKQFLNKGTATHKDKEGIKAFFIVLRTQSLSKARTAALIKGSKNINYLIDSLSQDYLRSKR